MATRCDRRNNHSRSRGRSTLEINDTPVYSTLMYITSTKPMYLTVYYPLSNAFRVAEPCQSNQALVALRITFRHICMKALKHVMHCFNHVASKASVSANRRTHPPNMASIMKLHFCHTTAVLWQPIREHTSDVSGRNFEILQNLLVHLYTEIIRILRVYQQKTAYIPTHCESTRHTWRVPRDRILQLSISFCRQIASRPSH